MLRDRRNLGIDCLNGRAKHTGETNLAGIAFQSGVDESIDLAADVTRSFGIGECLVGGSLVKTVGVGDLAEASCRSGVAQ